MDLRIDHVAFGWSDRSEIVAHLERLGLDPEYGGTHRDGTTAMSLVGFDDGTYLELIGPAGEEPPARWQTIIESDAGPAAWAVRVDDVAETAKTLIDRGLQAHGPVHDYRERPDGVRVEWDHCTFGGPSARRVYPFAIADRTPRSYRVAPSPSVANTALRGIAEIVVAVEDLDTVIPRFKRRFRFPDPIRRTHDSFEARLAHFPGQPVTLAEPAGSSWLRSRLASVGRGPASVLIVTDDMGEVRRDFPVEIEDRWFGRRLARFDSERLGFRLGVVEREE